MTRPDIAYHMSILCSCMHDPTKEAYDAAIQVLLYVGNTMEFTLKFTGKTSAPKGFDVDYSTAIASSSGLVAYSDASWNKSDHLGRNMFGDVEYLFGGPISFTSKRLNVVALSSAEAELYALVRGVCQTKGLISLMRDFGYEFKATACSDASAAIGIA